MKTIYIKTESHSESEADYETAIDIAYYSFSKTEHIFKFKNMNISFVMEESHKSTSYLEENFDEIGRAHV